MSSPEEPSLTEAEFQKYWSKFPDFDRSTMEVMLQSHIDYADVYHQYFTDNNDGP